MEALAPEQGICQKEIADLMPAIIENESSPILVSAAARVFVLVQRRSIKTGQSPIVARKLRWHPVNDYANAGLVQRVDQKLKVLRCSVPAGWGVESRDLVTPRRIKRMFRNRQELDVRKAHL